MGKEMDFGKGSYIEPVDEWPQPAPRPRGDGAEGMDEMDLSKDPHLDGEKCRCGGPAEFRALDGALWCHKCWAQSGVVTLDATERIDHVCRDPQPDSGKDATTCCQCGHPADGRAHLGDPWCAACQERAEMDRDTRRREYALRRTANGSLAGTVSCVPGMAPPPVKERMDRLPPRGLLWAGRAMGHGMKYEDPAAGTTHWEAQPASYHINRTLRHIVLHMAGDRSEDHWGHVMARALMAGDRLALEDGMVNTLDGRLVTPVDITGTWAGSHAASTEEADEDAGMAELARCCQLIVKLHNDGSKPGGGWWLCWNMAVRTLHRHMNEHGVGEVEV